MAPQAVLSRAQVDHLCGWGYEMTQKTGSKVAFSSMRRSIHIETLKSIFCMGQSSTNLQHLCLRSPATSETDGASWAWMDIDV